jgi:hypothetical protein
MQDPNKLVTDFIFRIDSLGESEFSVQDLLKDKWDSYTINDKRSGGRVIYKLISKGQLNKGGWLVEALPHTNPQYYKKQREVPLPKRQFLNDIPCILEIDLKEYIKSLEKDGKWLEIVDKPN